MCSVLMFVSAFHWDEQRGHAFIRDKREPLLDHIARVTEGVPSGISIWYIERAFTTNPNNGSLFIRLPNGQDITTNDEFSALGPNDVLRRSQSL